MMQRTTVVRLFEPTRMLHLQQSLSVSPTPFAVSSTHAAVATSCARARGALAACK